MQPSRPDDPSADPTDGRFPAASGVCGELEIQLVELLAGDLAADAASSLRDHASTCARCERLIATERQLVEALRALPSAPVIELRPPELPAGRVQILRPMRVLRPRIAVAAGLLAAAAVFGALQMGGMLPTSADRSAVEQAETLPARRVTVRRVIDGPQRLPVADEGLLALTAGIEAVAARRPVTRR